MGAQLMDPMLDGLTDAELMRAVALAKVLGERCRLVEREAKARLVDRMDPTEGDMPVAVDGRVVATLARTKGGDACTYRVDDPEKYAAWLVANGRATMTEPRPMPVDAALDKGWLKGLVEHELSGELPDGVAVRAPSLPQVRCTIDPEGAESLFDPGQSARLEGMLRLASPMDGEGAAEDAPDKPAEPVPDAGGDVFARMGMSV